jgi:hypothetical protein
MTAMQQKGAEGFLHRYEGLRAAPARRPPALGGGAARRGG